MYLTLQTINKLGTCSLPPCTDLSCIALGYSHHLIKKNTMMYKITIQKRITVRVLVLGNQYHQQWSNLLHQCVSDAV